MKPIYPMVWYICMTINFTQLTGASILSFEIIKNVGKLPVVTH